MNLKTKIKIAQLEQEERELEQKSWLGRKWYLFKKSKTLLCIVMLAIGISWTINIYEFYVRPDSLWKEYQQALRTFEEVKARSHSLLGSAAQAAGNQADLADSISHLNKEDASLTTSSSSQTPSIQNIVKKIFKKESSEGRNNYSKCEAIGKYNRYGYMIPGDGSYVCFEKDEDTKAVEKDIAIKLNSGLSLPQALCKYNTGKVLNDCPYYQDYLTL
jgi:hypothetical protein